MEDTTHIQTMNSKPIPTPIPSPNQDENQKNNEHIVINTKVLKAALDLVLPVFEKKKLTVYSVIQNIFECLMHNMTGWHRLTPDTQKTMGVFENQIGWENNFNFCDPTVKPEIGEAIYFVTAKGKTGARPVMVERPIMRKWRQTFNIQQILDRFMELAVPHIFKRLRYIQESRGCNSIIELLLDVIGDLEDEQMKAELLEDFQDNERSIYGQRPQDARYKRKIRKTIDMFETEEDNK